MCRKTILRCLVPLLGLALLGILAALYTLNPKVYYRALVTIGFPPFSYPFLDWESIGAAIKCWSEGINVYIANPCDVLNRLHNYSPLLLRAVFIPTDRAWTMPIGLFLVLAFLISLFWVVRPLNWRELIIFALACTSPMVVYLLERGNIDIIIFIMVVIAGVLSSGSTASRILSYALILLAGLLQILPVDGIVDVTARAAAHLTCDRRGGGANRRRVLLLVPRGIDRGMGKHPAGRGVRRGEPAVRWA